MVKLKLEIMLSGAAQVTIDEETGEFAGYAEYDIADLIHEAAARVAQSGLDDQTDFPVIDYNGNIVGSLKVVTV